MVTLTDDAVTAIRSLTHQAVDPNTAGVRIASSSVENALSLDVAAGPQEGDAVVEVSGAKLFLDDAATTVLDGRILHASQDTQGRLQFSITEQA
jgi:Fe-S cluster assembly iron-binding protein IscA